MRLLILNGPNLNRLGTREPEMYGSDSLASIEQSLREDFSEVAFTFIQSNHEGELIDAIQREDIDGIVLNAGGYSHTSVALRDAVAGASVPVVEVHITNIYSREEFRQHSLLSDVCVGQITGLGVMGYELAVRYLVTRSA